MKNQQVSLLWNNIYIRAPYIRTLIFKPTLPFYGRLTLNFPKLFTFGFASMSLFLGASAFLYLGYQFFRRAKNYIRSMFNAKKFLNPDTPIANEKFGSVSSSAPTS